MDRKIVEDNTIFLTISGSRAYGTPTATSDTDYRGVCIIPDKTYYFGMGINKFEQMDKGWGDDRVIYDIRKAMLLMSDCNPNMIDLLFVPERLWVISTPLWEKIYQHRNKFVSKKAKHTYSGYAFAQLKRIHIVNNPSESSRQEIKKYGFNTKNAMHLVRLLRMCEEILDGKGVNVVRSDAEELLSIRNGTWTIQQLQDYAAEMDIRLNELYKISTLPYEADKKFIDKLCVEIVEEYLDTKGKK